MMPEPQPPVAGESIPLTATTPVLNVTEGGAASASSQARLQASPSTETNVGDSLNQVAQTKSPPASWLWLNKRDPLFVGAFVAIFLVLSGYHWATLGGWGMQPIELERLPARQYDFRIDINSASWVEWTQIEGIGEATAQKIIADRDSIGPFRKIDDLLRIKGIGAKTLEKMRPFLREPNTDGDKSDR